VPAKQFEKRGEGRFQLILAFTVNVELYFIYWSFSSVHLVVNKGTHSISSSAFDECIP